MPKNDSVIALTSDDGHPLLAHWNYGLGRVVAFTSDTATDWASQWLSWDKFSAFWNQSVRWSMSAPVNHELQPTFSVTRNSASGATAHISVESLNPDNSFADLADVSAALRSTSGIITSTNLIQTAPGRYEGDVNLTEQGAYEVRLTRRTNTTTTETAGFSVPPNPEWLNAGTNDRLLKALNSSRAYLSKPEQALDITGLRAATPSYEPLWMNLLAPALVLLLASVAVRRLDFKLAKRDAVREA